MKKTLSLICVVLSMLAMLACTSVPAVESRLQTLQLHSNMYVVQAGETVESIAHRYQLSPGDLESLNPGLRSNITAGLRINVRPGTVLSNDVRSRANVAYGPSRQQPLIVDRPNNQQRPQQQFIEPNPVVIAPAPLRPEPVPERVPNQRPPTSIAEIQANSWSDEPIAMAGNVTEEIIADPLDFEPVDPVVNDRAAMNSELQQYVGTWSWPTNGQVAREFAPGEVGGQGVDIAGVPGQSIHAAMAGTVVYSGRDLSGGGNLIIVRHNNNLMTTYSHADQLYVAEDDQVAAGDPIASLGWNANRESVLRFEVRKDGNPLDPMKFLPLR